MSLTDHTSCQFVSCAICGPALAEKQAAIKSLDEIDVSWMTRENLENHYRSAMANWNLSLDERNNTEKELALEREAHRVTRANYEQAYASQIVQRKILAGVEILLKNEQNAHAATREQRDTAERCFARLTTDFDVTRESLRLEREAHATRAELESAKQAHDVEAGMLAIQLQNEKERADALVDASQPGVGDVNRIVKLIAESKGFSVQSHAAGAREGIEWIMNRSRSAAEAIQRARVAEKK